MFTKDFGSYVCPGDTITCTVGRFTATATIHHDVEARGTAEAVAKVRQSVS